jgi:hypothetical protein
MISLDPDHTQSGVGPGFYFFKKFWMPRDPKIEGPNHQVKNVAEKPELIHSLSAKGF